jgi:hypothetical protein
MAAFGLPLVIILRQMYTFYSVLYYFMEIPTNIALQSTIGRFL